MSHPTHAPHRLERGQALPLLALAMVVLIAFAGLALDGGNLYTEQRRAQAAADNAVLAAAFKQMKQLTPLSLAQARTLYGAAALANAAENRYDDVNNNRVFFHMPPISGPYSGTAGYMQVVITETVPTMLIHLVYQGPVGLSVSAVAHGIAPVGLMEGFAIASMNPGVCNGNDFNSNGNSESVIEGGGVFINANCAPGLVFNGGGKLATSNVGVYPPDGAFPITIVGTTNGTNCSSANPYTPNGCNLYPSATIGAAPVNPDPMANTPVQPAVVEAVCDAMGNGTETDNGLIVNFTPGNFQHMSVGNNETIMLAPGVYCVNGLGPANSVLGAKSIIGQGVLIYIMHPDAEFKFAGNGLLNLSGITQQQCDADLDLCPFINIVVYKPYGNNDCQLSGVEISFAGQAEMIVQGLIYAPQSLIKYGGNGTLTMIGQALSGCVIYGGNGTISIVYDPDQSYIPPPQIVLDQ